MAWSHPTLFPTVLQKHHQNHCTHIRLLNRKYKNNVRHLFFLFCFAFKESSWYLLVDNTVHQEWTVKNMNNFSTLELFSKIYIKFICRKKKRNCLAYNKGISQPEGQSLSLSSFWGPHASGECIEGQVGGARNNSDSISLIDYILH